MKTIKREVGRHVASVVATKREIRVAHSRSGYTLLVEKEGAFTQILPESFGEDNPEGLYTNLQDAFMDLNNLLKEGTI